MDITDESPFHCPRWDLFPLENALNFAELGEELCEDVAVDFVWDMSDVNVICSRSPSCGIFESIGSVGSEIGLVGSFPVVERFVDRHEMIHPENR